MQEYANQIAELKASQAPGAAALRSALLDPSVNLLLQRLRQELLSTRARLEETQNELSAWKFTPDSNTGKRLMAKCRLLYQENEELGRMISSGRLAKLEGDLALQKSFSEEVKKSQSELDEFLQDLDEDVEGMQSTIYYLQQELRKAKEAYATLQQENSILKSGGVNATEHNNELVTSEVGRESRPRTPVCHNGLKEKGEEDSRGWDERTRGSDGPPTREPSLSRSPGVEKATDHPTNGGGIQTTQPQPPEEDSVSCGARSPEDTCTARSPEDTCSVKSPEDTRSVKSPEGTHSVRSPEGTRSVRSPEGTRSVRSPEGTRSVRSPEDTRSVRSPEDTHSVRSPEDTRSAKSPEDTRSAKSPEDTCLSPPPIVQSQSNESNDLTNMHADSPPRPSQNERNWEKPVIDHDDSSSDCCDELILKIESEDIGDEDLDPQISDAGCESDKVRSTVNDIDASVANNADRTTDNSDVRDQSRDGRDSASSRKRVCSNDDSSNDSDDVPLIKKLRRDSEISFNYHDDDDAGLTNGESATASSRTSRK